MKMIRDAVKNKEVCTCCVQSIFIVAGGNDAENIRSPSGMDNLKSAFNKLIQLINNNFPVIRVNIVSLMPRRCYSYTHLQRIFEINDFLSVICKSSHNCFLIKMFTKFLLYKALYYMNNEVYLNEKLYKADRLHFSTIGTSVLAKTLIAVANDPRY